MASTIVIALGGNAIKQSDQKGTFEEQFSNIEIITAQLVELVKKKNRLIITHGNGPQVGNLLIQQEEAKDFVPEQPLDVVGAMTQGQIGYMFQQSLRNKFLEEKINTPVITIINQVEVDPDNNAFNNPTKPVGPFYTKEEAQKLTLLKGLPIKKVIPNSLRCYRHVVPSPLPKKNMEAEIVKLLCQNGVIVIASGGGGIPVTTRNSKVCGVEAVIDKDLAGEILAEFVGADILMLMTDIKKVKKNFGKEDEEEIDKMTIAQAKNYLKEGHFLPGSMGPKVVAAVNFIEAGGKLAIISSIDKIVESLEGTTGTRIVNNN
ncbi:MAG: carbamate kinase [Candidatus Methanofastidiosia archaeon]